MKKNAYNCKLKFVLYLQEQYCKVFSVLIILKIKIMRKGISFKSLLAILFVGTLLVSCKSSNQSSRTTGWNYNDDENGGFYITDSQEQATGPGLVAIEGGTFTMGATIENVYYEWNNNPRKVTVSSFYMDQTEVSNLDYLEYIFWLERVYSDYPDVIKNALPDTLVWRSSLSYNEPMVEIYFRHPAFRDYPVVGVTWKQANDYALWRSDRVNEKILVDAGALNYNNEQTKDYHFTTDAYLAGRYTGSIVNNDSVTTNEQGNQKIQMEDGILLPKYRLPTEAEWEYAARGGKYSNGYIYSGSNNLDEVAWTPLNSEDSTHAVASKMPNELGIYDMSGNVWEWCRDFYSDYSSSHQDNPNGPAEGTQKVMRGGSYFATVDLARVSTRYSPKTTRFKAHPLGFRLVMEIDKK